MLTDDLLDSLCALDRLRPRRGLDLRAQLVLGRQRVVAVIDHRGGSDFNNWDYTIAAFEALPEVCRHVVADFTALRYMTSSLGTYVNLADRLDAAGGELRLCSVHPKVRVVYDLLELGEFFTFDPDRSTSLRALGVYPPAADDTLRALLDRALGDPEDASLRVTADALTERDDPRAAPLRALLGSPELAYDGTRHLDRDPQGPPARLVLPLADDVAACFRPASRAAGPWHRRLLGQ